MMPDMAKEKSWWRDAKMKVEGQIENAKAQHAEGAAAAGNLVVEKTFGTSTIAIYDGGFVRVTVLRGMTPFTPFEKLRSIQYRETVQDRGSLSNVAYRLPGASKQKRTVHLTIATDRKVHTLTSEAGPMGGDVKSGMALEAAGRAVLDTSASMETARGAAAAPPDIADQLRKLADLHSAGVLTDEEFAAKKADLLNRM